MNIASLVSAVFGGSTDASVTSALASNVLTAVVGNATLSGLNTAAHAAVKAAVTELDNGIDMLTAAFTKFESTNPLVQNAMTAVVSLAKGQGLQLPTEGDLVTHVKAAIADVAASFGIGAVSATPTPTASTSAA